MARRRADGFPVKKGLCTWKTIVAVYLPVAIVASRRGRGRLGGGGSCDLNVVKAFFIECKSRSVIDRKMQTVYEYLLRAMMRLLFA